MGKMPAIGQLKGRPLGRVLIKMGKLTRDKVHQALSVQKKSAKKMMEMGGGLSGLLGGTG